MPPEPAATNDTADTKKAKDTAQAIEKIDPNKQGQDFLTEVNNIMKAQGLSGNDATSKLVIAQLERDGKLPKVLLAMSNEQVLKSLAGSDQQYSKEELEKIGRGEGVRYGTKSDEASKLLANAMLSRFGAIAEVDQKNSDNKNIRQKDLQKYGDDRAGARGELEQMLSRTGNINEQSPDIFKRIANGETVDKYTITRALERDQDKRDLAKVAGLSPEKMKEFGILSEEDRKALQFMADKYDKITGVQNDAKGINKDILAKYSRIQGTSQEVANQNYSDYAALEKETKPAETKPADDPTKADPKKAKDAAAAIGAIPDDKKGAAYAAEVEKIMQANGLHGNDASSKLMIAELERQGKLPNFLAQTLGTKEAINSLAPGQSGDDEKDKGYSKEQLEKLAKGEGPTPGTQANDTTRLAAQAMLDRYSALADLDYIDHNDDGKNAARDDHKNKITVSDIQTYAGQRVTDGSVGELDRKRVQFRNDVNQVLNVTSNVGENDPQVLKDIRDGKPVNEEALRRALERDQDKRDLAKVANLTPEQQKQYGIMTDDQQKAVKYMLDHYKGISGMEENSKGVTNKLLDAYATNMGTNRDIAKAQADAIKALDAKVEPPAVQPPDNTGDTLDKRANAIVDAVRALPDDVKGQFKDGMSREELQAIIKKDETDNNLTVSQRDTLVNLDKDWDKLVGKDKTADLSKFATPEQEARQGQLDKDAQAKLKGVSGQNMEGLVDDKGNIDKGKLDALLSNPLYAQNEDPNKVAQMQYLQQHFNEISHNGTSITPDQMAAYAKLHGMTDYQPYKVKGDAPQPQPAAEDPALKEAYAKFDAMKQEDTLGGQPPYYLAQRALTERAKLTGEPVNHQAIMNEVARLIITNEIGPESVRANLQKMLDAGQAISEKNLPKALNNVPSSQVWKLYTPAEREKIAKANVARAAGKDTNGDGVVNADDYSYTGG